jgi:subtilisin family serine protease
MKETLKMKVFVSFGLLALVWLAMITSLPSRGVTAGGDKNQIQASKDEIIVRLNRGVKIDEINDRYETFLKEHLAGTDNYLLGLPHGAKRDELLELMSEDVDLIFAEPNRDLQLPEPSQTSHAFIDQTSHAFIDHQSPALFYGQQPLESLNLREAHNHSRGFGVKVAVIDTGLDLSHPLFGGRIALPAYDFVDNDGWPADEPGGAGSGHGTFIAGLIRLSAPDATIMPLRVFDEDGYSSSFKISKAIRFAVDNDAQVLNLSFGLSKSDKTIKDALAYARKHVVMVASAGNDNRDAIHFPAREKDKALSVTSTTANDLKAPFANFNKDLDAAAPGVSLYSAYPGGRWAWWSGTSFSTALVTGEVALLLSLNPKLKSKDLSRIIEKSGANIDSLNTKYKNKLGRRIDCRAAVNMVLYEQ